MFTSHTRFSVSETGGVAMRNRDSSPTSRMGALPKRSTTETASPFLLDIAGQGSNSMRASVSNPAGYSQLLTGIMPEHEEVLRRFYRDIYLYDSVAGSAIDMISAFPFSEYILTGADTKQLEKFNESLHRLNLRSLMPEMSTAYLTDSEFIGTLIFDQSSKVFADVIIYDPNQCNIKRIPFFSADPEITVITSPEARAFMTRDSKYAQAVRENIPASFLAAMRSAGYDLNPVNTLYLARRVLPSHPPISYLKRILPIYLLEKQLYRGTLVEAHKRQRSLLHVTMGDDNWEPTPEEMDAVTAMFQQAELDPLGAIITTRSTIQPTEIRQGGEFWKWTDTADVLVPYKLRALGISEAFLSSDANYSNSETALSVFLENLESYRSFLTYKTFTSKIFPIIAYTNEYFRDKSKATNLGKNISMLYTINNQENLIIPTVSWRKKLSARSEANPMDLLEKLGEKGIPIPLRMWAAAAEVDLDTMLYEMEQDKKYRDIIARLAPEGATNEDQDEGMENTLGSLARSVPRMPGADTGFPRKVPLMAREFGEASEMVDRTKTGKRKYIFSQNAASHRANELIAKAVKALQDPNVRASAKKRVIAHLGHMPNIITPGLTR